MCSGIVTTSPALARARALVGSSPKVVRAAAAASAASAGAASPRARRTSRFTCKPCTHLSAGLRNTTVDPTKHTQVAKAWLASYICEAWRR